MISKIYFTKLTLIGICFTSLTSCNPRGGNNNDKEVDSLVIVDSIEQSYSYNFYIENSGSVKGYFNGKNNDAGVIIREIYDRLEEQLSKEDTITLNFINNKVIPQKTDIDKWLNTAAANCNEAYSDLDKVLEQTLANTNKESVNFVVSDFCFESKDGDLRKAQSGITKIFAKALKSNCDLSVAIFKYDASFDGYYYPGRIRHQGKRPLYIWVFGPSSSIKRIANLKTRQVAVHELYLQAHKNFYAKVTTNNSRMTSKNKDCVIVKEWKSDRYEQNVYKANLSVTLDEMIISPDELSNIHNYIINPSEFFLDEIRVGKNGESEFFISTEKPHPGKLTISYKNDTPAWVETSNTELNSLPNDGLTYGIKYLIEGVIDAYRNINEDIFCIEFTFK